MTTIGSRIAFFRTRQGLSRSQLAELSGCTRNTIRSLEQWDERYRNPTIDKIYGIAKALGIHPFHLLDDIFHSPSAKEGPRIDIKDYLKMGVGGRIKAVRVWRGFSLKALADKCTLSVDEIKAVEKSNRAPFAQFYRIALELDIPPFWLLPEPSPLESKKVLETPNSVKQVLSLFKGLPSDQKQKALVALIKELNGSPNSGPKKKSPKRADK